MARVVRRARALGQLVLVVDSRVEIRELLTDFVRRLDLIAIPVPDAAHARVMLRALKLDLILLDLGLPDVTGTELLREFKSERPHTPVIVISGYDNADSADTCRKVGAEDVLPKPLDLGALRKVIFRHLKLPAPRAREVVTPPKKAS